MKPEKRISLIDEITSSSLDFFVPIAIISMANWVIALEVGICLSIYTGRETPIFRWIRLGRMSLFFSIFYKLFSNKI